MGTFQKLQKLKRSKCYICHSRGHGFLNCPNKNRGREIIKGKKIIENNMTSIGKIVTPQVSWLVIGTDNKTWNEIWYVTNDYSRHMTPNLEIFEKFKKNLACTSLMGQKGLDVRGLGVITVDTYLHKFAIPGAFYVTNIGLNLLSLSQLEQQGFEVVIKDGKCTIKSMFDTTSTEDLITLDSHKETESISEKVDQNDGDTHMEDRSGLEENKEKAIRAIMEYYDSLYFGNSIVEEKTSEKEIPSANEFESFIDFLSMVNDQEIMEGCKGSVEEHFGKLVKWFYEIVMGCEERPTPVKINDQDVSLLDLYLTVKSFGGHARVSIKNCWIDIAKAMDLQGDCADYLKELYATHLSLLAAYYDVAKNYSSGYYVPKAMDCSGASGVAEANKPEVKTERGVESNEEREVESSEEREAESSEEREAESNEENTWYVKKNGIEGKIEFDDGETLIVSFNKDVWEGNQFVKERNDKDVEDVIV